MNIYSFGKFWTACCLIILSCLLPACASGSQRVQKEDIESFRPWGLLGARIKDSHSGVVVVEVTSGSSAEEAGLRVGDRVLEVGGSVGLRAEKIIDDIRSRLPGSMLAIRFSQNGTEMTARVRVGEYPRDEQLLLMASSAEKSLDFTRALALCRNFEQSVPHTSRYASLMRDLKASVLEKLAKE